MINALNDRFTIELVHALAWSLLHFLWQGCIVACAFAAMMHLTRRYSAQTRYLLGCAALAILAVAPIITFAIIWQSAMAFPTTLASMPREFAHAITTPAAPSMSIPMLAVVLVWALGTVVSSTWLCGGILQIFLLRTLPTIESPVRMQALVDQLASLMHVRAAVRVVDSALATIPMTIGWMAPVILLPAGTLAGLSTTQLKAIIAHELAHVRRWDYLVNLFQRLLESLFFFHPAVWWISARIRQEREYCCDDIAAAVCGDRVLYAQALAELEALRSTFIQLALSSQGGSLMNRITRLLGIPTPEQPRSSRTFVALAAGALLATVSAAFAIAQAPHAQQNATTQPTDQAASMQENLPLVQNNDSNSLWELTLEEPDEQVTVNTAEGVYELHFVVTTNAGEPIDRLIEARELSYPWDIFDAVLGPEPSNCILELSQPCVLHTVTQLHQGLLTQGVQIGTELELGDNIAEGSFTYTIVPQLHIDKTDDANGLLELEVIGVASSDAVHVQAADDGVLEIEVEPTKPAAP